MMTTKTNSKGKTIFMSDNTNCDMDKIKNRIKKLLAIAADDAILDGEVATAMTLAEEAMEKYHLSRAEVEATETDQGIKVEQVFVREHSVGQGVRLTNWEKVLATSVEVLIGSAGSYCDNINRPSGAFGKPKRRGVITWYGPDEDVRLADGLFREWSTVIATIAMGKYNSVARGAGARYAYGFAVSLYHQAKDHAQKRRDVVTPATRALTINGESLHSLLIQKKRKAKNWLSTEHDIKIRTTKNTGYSDGCTGGSDAYDTGRSDGKRADFKAKRQHKLSE